MTFSYRGYGLSTGAASEKGLKIDAECILNYLAEHPKVKKTKLVLYGRSLGGAVAIYAATLPIAKEMVAGVVLENTFLSIPKLIPRYVFFFFFTILKCQFFVAFILTWLIQKNSVMPIARHVIFLVDQIWNSEHTITQMPSSIPLLFMSGARDELVPPAHMAELYRLSPARTKILKSLPKGMHNTTVQQKNYFGYFGEFVRGFVEPLEKVTSEDRVEKWLNLPEQEQE